MLFNQPWNVNFNAEGNGMIRVNDWIDVWNLLIENEGDKIENEKE